MILIFLNCYVHQNREFLHRQKMRYIPYFFFFFWLNELKKGGYSKLHPVTYEIFYIYLCVKYIYRAFIMYVDCRYLLYTDMFYM